MKEKIILFKQQCEHFSASFLYILYIGLSMYYPVYSIILKRMPNHIDKLILVYHILLILLLVKIVFQNNSIIDWILLAIMLYLCAKSYQYNYDFYNIFGTMMFLLCAKNIKLDKIIKLDFYIRIIRFVLYFILPYFGWMSNHIHFYVGGRERTFYGWTHPNMMGIDFLLLAMDIFYLRKESRKWYDILLYGSMIVLLDITANSRTAEGAIFLLIIMQLVYLGFNEEIRHVLVIFFTVLSYLLSVLLPALGCYLVIQHPDIIYKYTGTLVSRFALTADFYSKNMGLGFYGFPLYSDFDCLDMLFSYVGLHWGICAFIIFNAAILYCLYHAIKLKHTDILVLLLIFFLYSNMETAHIFPTYSYFTLIIGFYCMNRKSHFPYKKKLPLYD